MAENERGAFEGDSPQLFTMNNAYGPNAAAQWLVFQLVNMMEFAGVRQKLDVNQQEQLARMIVQEFGFLNVEELMLFFYRLKGGRYGQFYGVVDPMVVLAALRDGFMPERAVWKDRLDNEKRQRERDAWRDEPGRMNYRQYIELIQKQKK